MSNYRFILSEKDGTFVGLVLSKNQLIANTIPNTNKSRVINYLKAKRNQLTMEHVQIEETSHRISDIIFKLDNSPKKYWKEALSVDLNFQLYSKNQAKVAKTLRKLPIGEVISYGKLAKMSGFPNGARFVGNCMANNHIPLIVPCHRVIMSNGKLGNYSGEGGRERKREYLIKENAISTN